MTSGQDDLTFVMPFSELVSEVESKLSEADGVSLMPVGGELDLTELSCRQSLVVGLRLKLLPIM